MLRKLHYFEAVHVCKGENVGNLLQMQMRRITTKRIFHYHGFEFQSTELIAAYSRGRNYWIAKKRLIC